MSLYYFGNARTPEQLGEMRRLEEAGICIFCPDQTNRANDLRVLHRTPHWTIVPNRYPYRGTGLHLLMVPDEHVTDMADLSPAAQADFWAALAWIRDEYALTHYGLAVRNGETEFNGGTIRHLHLHVVRGDVDDPEHYPVRVRLSSRPDPADDH